MRDPATASPVSPNRCGWKIAGFAVVAVALIGGSFFLDASVERWVAVHQDPTAVAVAKAISRFGAWPWLMLAAAAGLALARFLRSRETMRILICMIVASSAAGLSADLLRNVTGRTRPYATTTGIAPQGWYGMRAGSQWLVGNHAYNAFPSGHTATATAFGVTLFWSRRALGAALLGGAVVVAATRVYLGAHHFSDVIAGAVLGVAIAAWLHSWLMRWLLRCRGLGESLED